MELIDCLGPIGVLLLALLPFYLVSKVEEWCERDVTAGRRKIREEEERDYLQWAEWLGTEPSPELRSQFEDRVLVTERGYIRRRCREHLGRVPKERELIAYYDVLRSEQEQRFQEWATSTEAAPSDEFRSQFVRQENIKRWSSSPDSARPSQPLRQSTWPPLRGDAVKEVVAYDSRDAGYLRALKYDDYLRTEHWKEVRQQALERAHNRCQLCARHDGVLQVHHNNYGRRGQEEAHDLVVLCQACHARFHDVAKLSRRRRRRR